jgi:glutaminyl-peptide cyclotransferase
VYRVQVVHTYPHDPSAFTQGLEYHNGLLYEGTGLQGRSALRVEHLANATVIRRMNLSSQYFGEGITVLNGRIYQLTWTAHKGFVYGASTFHLLREFEYPGEGWGLANDGKLIYMSDGSYEIRVWDPSTLAELRRIKVHDGQQPIDMLNELEWVKGELFANVWQTDRIARISPADGRVLGWIDASGLLKPGEAPQRDVLNGIAFDARQNRLFVTGKLWPKLFEVRLVRQP